MARTPAPRRSPACRSRRRQAAPCGPPDERHRIARPDQLVGGGHEAQGGAKIEQALCERGQGVVPASGNDTQRRRQLPASHTVVPGHPRAWRLPRRRHGWPARTGQPCGRAVLDLGKGPDDLLRVGVRLMAAHRGRCSRCAGGAGSRTFGGEPASEQPFGDGTVSRRIDVDPLLSRGCRPRRAGARRRAASCPMRRSTPRRPTHGAAPRTPRA